jgi:glutamyl-tRNA synthetase
LSQILTAAGDRVKMAGDVLDYDDFYVADEQLVYDAAALEKRIAKPPAARELLAAFSTALDAVEPFDAATLDKMLHAFIEERGVKIGDVVHAVRVAITGKAVGFGLFDALAILGREHCQRRIARAMELAD